jgi:hypothetical protein
MRKVFFYFYEISWSLIKLCTNRCSFYWNSVFRTYDLVAMFKTGMYGRKRCIVGFLLFASVSFAQTNIKRSSLSTGSHTLKIGAFSMQQSIGQMSFIQSSQQSGNTMISGFLIPQNFAQYLQGNAAQSSLEWSLYPNPFSTHINIKFSLPVAGDMHLLLYNLAGKLMMEKTLKAKQKQRIPLEHLAEGSYIMNISVLEKSFSTQIFNKK